MREIALVRARNASPLTLTGTNSYIINCGDGHAICIDPGPRDDAHIAALKQRARDMGCAISAICLTHSHPDHAPAAAALAAETGAAVWAHRAASVTHDRDLSDGDVVRAGDGELFAVETPGHTRDHLAFYEPHARALFTGDAVLGEGYVVIAPPQGDMRAYQNSLRKLLRDFPHAQTIYGGHGDPVGNPHEKLRDYIEHRRKREDELLSALAGGAKTIPDLLETIYAQTDRALWPAAARQLLAHLIALEHEDRVRSRIVAEHLEPDLAAILNPEWSRIVGPEQAEVIEKELGSELRIERLRSYELVP